MPKRGENIHKRKDGRWEGRYLKERRFDGTIRYGSVYGKSYREVKEKLPIAIMKVNASDATQEKEMYFREVLALWMSNNQIRLKRATVTKYQNSIDNHILPELGNVKLSNLDATMINEFLMHKLRNGKLDGKGGLSPVYVRSIMVVINAAIKYAVDEQLMKPLKSPICKPAIEKKEISILSVDEQKRLESYLNRELNLTKIGIEQNRCAMACQGCGAVFLLLQK